MRRCFGLNLAWAWLLLAVLRVEAVPVTGKVLGPDDKPVAGAKVLLRSYVMPRIGQPNEGVVVETNAEGVFGGDIEDAFVSPSLGTALVVAPGLAPQQAAINKDNKPLVLRLGLGVRVSGVLKDAEGKAVADATVRLKTSSGTRSYINFQGVPQSFYNDFSASTASDGRWSLDNLPPNSRISLELNDVRFGTVVINAETKSVQLEAPEVVARPAATLSGKVRYADGRPVVGVHLQSRSSGGSFASAVSGVDGSYQIGSLAAGSYRITVRGQDDDWVAVPLENVFVREGQTYVAPDLTLIKGALIQGTITDAESGVPVKGVFVMVTEGSARGISDEKGHYKMRVVPGKIRVYVFNKPAEYLYPDEASPQKQKALDVAENETKTLDLKLAKGVAITGIVRDEAGKIVTAINLRMKEKSESWAEPKAIEINERGEWNLSGLNRDTYFFMAQDEWEVVRPRQVALPQAGRIEIVVKKVLLQTASGRVVTPDGQPVEKAQVECLVLVPQGPSTADGGSSWTPRTTKIETNANGQWTLDKLRHDYSVQVTVSREGYKFIKGGETKNDNGQWAAEDVVMLPLLGRITGRVVDAAGQAAAGIKVLSPDGGKGARTTTDAAGRFTLTELPEEEVTLIAVGSSGAHALTRRPGATDITVTLRPVSAVMAPNVELARDIVYETWETSRGSGWWERNALPSVLANHNLDWALQLARDGNDKNAVPADVLGPIIQELVEKNPQRALEWAPAQLAAWPSVETTNRLNAYLRLLATVEVAFAAAKIKPELAAQLYADAQKIELSGELSGRRTFLMGALAARLGKPEVKSLTEKALEASKSEHSPSETLSSLAQILAQGSGELAEQVLAMIPVSKQDGHRGHAYAESIKTLASYDLPSAEHLFNKLEKLPESVSPYYVSQSAISLITAVGPHNPKHALALARRVTDREFVAEVLLAAARYQPKEEALTLLREAAQKQPDHYSPRPGLLSRMAWLAYELDPKAGSELIEQARLWVEARMKQSDNSYWRGHQASNEVAMLALVLRRVDPAAARMMLEEEWAFQKNLTGPDTRHNDYSPLVIAMASLDPARALELSWQVPTRDDNDNSRAAQFDTQRRIALFLLDPHQPLEKIISRF